MLLESRLHGDSSFVTLTYDEEHLPEEGSLNPRHTQGWLKRLRKSLGADRVRYYLVGEYGESTWRPHYHVALFGYPACERGRTEHRESVCCGSCQRIKETWGFGGVDVGELTLESAQYIAGYVTKKLTVPDSEVNRLWRIQRNCLLGERHPEFARMSRRPGIGAGAMSVVGSSLLQSVGVAFAEIVLDVPNVLMHDRKKWPLGRYLVRKLREEVGRDVEAPEAVRGAYVETLRAMYREALVQAENKNKTVGKIVVDANQGKRLNLQSRMKIYSGGHSL